MVEAVLIIFKASCIYLRRPKQFCRLGNYQEYKSGTASIAHEGVQACYRLTPANACGNGRTTGNTASQLQTEYDPAVILTDKIFFSALLTSAADVSVTVGNVIVLGKETF
jgi:hypothetical protein